MPYPDPTASAPERLADQRAFLVRLARALTADEHAANDLVQDTWLAALERRIAPSRALLARMLRNRWVNVRKGDDRRRTRERAVARGEAEGAPRALEELEIQQRVLDAVRALPEAQRGAIWMRYWHGLRPERIARETGAGLETVRSRLAHGRARLRARLARDLGGEGLAVLVGFAPRELAPSERAHWPRPAASEATPPAGVGLGPAVLSPGVFMGAMGKGLAAAALVVAGTYLVLRRPAGAAEGERAVVPDHVDAVATDLRSPEFPIEPARTAVAVPATDVPRSPPTPGAESSGLLGKVLFAGRVLDDEVRPVSGVEVALRRLPRADSALLGTVRTDERGEFALEVAATGAVLWVEDEDWVTVGPALSSGQESVVLVARRAPLRGTVTDVAGIPLAEARLAIELPVGFRSRYPFALDSTLGASAGAVSAQDGRFDLVDATRVRDSFLVCERDGFVTRRLGLDQVGSEVVVALDRLGQGPDSLDGWVVDAAGRAVEGATVSFGAERTRSGPDGGFRLAARSGVSQYERLREAIGGESASVSALAPGHLPGRVDVPLDAAGRPSWPQGVVIVLGGEPLAIEGLVVDAAGRPLPDAMLWLEGTEVFSMEDGGVSQEALLSGSTVRHLEFRADELGRFAIEGLLDREYVLGAMDRRTSVIARSAPVWAGARDVRIAIDREAIHARVAGHVRGLDGTPVAGAEVLLMAEASEMRFRGHFVRNSSLLVRRTTSGPDGSFALTSVPREQVTLEVVGEGVEPTRFPLEDLTGGDVEAVELLCPRRVHVRVTLDEAGAADEFAILDVDEVPLLLRVYRGKPGPASPRAPIHGQASDTLSVGQSGRTLVLYRNGIEVERRRIWLAADGLNEF